MPKTTTQRTSRRTAITAGLALTAALAVPAAALAADAPTLGAPTILTAGQHSPIDVGGNNLHQHDLIRRGTQLVRWPVAMHGKSSATVTLTCPTGTVQSGLGSQEGSQIYPAVPGASYFKRSVDVSFTTPPNVDQAVATGHVYMLCRDPAIAPMLPAIYEPVILKAGQRSPIDVAGNHLHRGDTIAKGTRLLRFPVLLRGNSRNSSTLECPRGTVDRGLGFQEGTKLEVIPFNKYGHRRMRVHINSRPGVSAVGTKGSVYALCG
jgi:hypothetical protein